ncbi:erv26 super protein [Cladochytrium tenue]|nr:erv26 super protein [Cladochytrium tenue]
MGSPFLGVLAYVAGAILAVFLLLSLASGLYYLAELVESVAVCHVGLLVFDSLPPGLLAFSLVCHAAYSRLYVKFPNIQLLDPPFVASCVLVLADHLLWFWYFLSHPLRFSEISAFFGVIVWLVPFTYFISLSANEYTLPAFDPSASSSSSARPARRRPPLAKALLDFVLQRRELLPSQYSQPPSAPPMPQQQQQQQYRETFQAAAAGGYAAPPPPPTSSRGASGSGLRWDDPPPAALAFQQQQEQQGQWGATMRPPQQQQPYMARGANRSSDSAALLHRKAA